VDTQPAGDKTLHVGAASLQELQAGEQAFIGVQAFLIFGLLWNRSWLL
jgi:hypothetical protein